MPRRGRRRRRGPGLLGTTMLVGGAYAMGSSGKKGDGQDAQQNVQQEQRLNELEKQQAVDAALAQQAATQEQPQAPVQQEQQNNQQQVAQGGTDNISKLKELASLKEQGILTEEEFQSEKKKILG